MTFEEYQKSKGRNYSSEADYKEYQKAMQQQKGGQQVAPQQPPAAKAVQKAAAAKQLKVSAPPLKGAPLVDGSGQQSGVADASGNVAKSTSRAQSVLDAYKKNKVATQASLKSEDIDRSVKGLETAAKKDAIDFPDQAPPADDGLSFTGNTKGVMAATSMGMQAVNAKNDAQAIVGGAGAGMQVASMLSGAGAGPAGLAVGAGTAVMGMINSRKERKRAEAAARKEEEKLRKQKQQAKELQLMQSHSSERQAAFSNLMANL